VRKKPPQIKGSKKEPEKTQQRNTWVSQTAVTAAELHHPGVEKQPLTIKQPRRRENKKRKKSSEEE
jgi:hypothetical protein